ncbi:MAG: DNA repair protein RadA [Acidimicrobiia bacterium]|nr:DNA repair protein RadA [Acidimicrobiia bacterium]
MSRTRVRHARHRCAVCGATSPQWLGRCPECGEWGSLAEETAPVRAGAGGVGSAACPRPLAEVDMSGTVRRPTGVDEVDRVLGGGLVPGSVTLLGGEPGIGKSTVALQMLAATCSTGVPVLLVSAEESPEQVRLRAGRLGALDPHLLVVAETRVPEVLAAAGEVGPRLLVIDSIQTVHDPESTGPPGSIAQVRDAAAAVVRFAKETGVATVLVGHVTKEGALAGPRVLEHLVDTVLSFEGDRHHALRMLRASKHRFGPTDEIGLFEMGAGGLRGVPDASAFFLADRCPATPGSVVTAVVDGTRPLLVEVQALTAVSASPHAPLDPWTRRCAARDAPGGAHAACPGSLRLARRVRQRHRRDPRNRHGGRSRAGAGAGRRPPRPAGCGRRPGARGGRSGGEVRQIAHAPRRLAEAARLGFRRAVVPASTPDVPGVRLERVATVEEALVAAGLLAPAPGDAGAGSRYDGRHLLAMVDRDVGPLTGGDDGSSPPGTGRSGARPRRW